MSNKIYEKREALLKDRINRVGLRQLERLYGINTTVYRSEKNVFSKIYGQESGEIGEQLPEPITVLITGDTFAPLDVFSATLLTEGWLYSSKIDLIKSGDLIQVMRKDGRAYQFKVTELGSLGMTTVVLTRYKLAAHAQEPQK